MIRGDDVDPNTFFTGQQGDRLRQAGELFIFKLLTNIVEEVGNPFGMLVTDHCDLKLGRLELTFHTHAEHSFYCWYLISSGRCLHLYRRLGKLDVKEELRSGKNN